MLIIINAILWMESPTVLLLIEKYEELENSKCCKLDMDILYKKIEKQKKNVSAGKFGTVVFFAMSLFGVILYFRFR